jgi:hypothetical protein
MSKIISPIRFSEQFGIAPNVIRDLGAFDPILNADTRLFIDPLLLSSSECGEMKYAHEVWGRHFEKLIKLLSSVQEKGDPAWRVVDKQLSFREFKGTCLGYGSGSISGTALASNVRQRIISTAMRITELGIEDPEFFTLIPLLEEDVGPDSISDMTSHVIARQLASFSMRVLEGISLAREAFQIGGEEFSLPKNPFESDRGRPLPVVLVPLDVLRDLPVASDRNDIARVAAENDELRDKISASIGQIWEKKSRHQKDELRRSALASREAFETLLELLRSLNRTAYDIERDPAGRSRWLEAGRAIAKEYPMPLALQSNDRTGLRAIVERIIENYKYLIENQGVWKALYDSIGGKPLHEHYSQKVFFVTAEAHCKANNLDITPEANSGAGPVDFKFATGYENRVLVELKLSTNPHLKNGYTKQLEAYMRAERAEVGYYVILYVGGSVKQMDEVLRLEALAKNSRKPHSPVTVIDASQKPSASKL